jgi:glycosyltransferase involved in cell wall biosynthesis
MSRHRALLLTPRFPWPLDDGGRIAAWQCVRAAAREYETTLVSLVPPGEERAPIPREFEECGIHVVRVVHRPPAAFSAALDGLIGRWPYTITRYQNPELSRKLRALTAEVRPRFALVNNLHLAPYVDDLNGVPMILREQNLEHLWMDRYARRLGWTPAGLYARIQAKRLRAAESALCQRAALVLAIQEEEAAQLRKLVPGVRVEVLPVGVDLTRYEDPHPDEPPVVLLAGSFAWLPNVDGALEFLRRGWPQVQPRIPRARLRIVGKDLPRSLVRAANKVGADPVGYVESMSEEFARASVFVVPVWVGAGVRVKITEAMAARVPVVATRLAAEGLGLNPGEHYAASDTAEGLGGQVAALLLAPEVRAALAERGRTFAEARWSLEAIANLQNALCAGVGL